MKNRKMFMVVLLAVISIGSVSAADITSFADPYKPGSLLISTGLGVGSVKYWFLSAGAVGFTVAVDYALPVAALTIGGEVGFFGSPEFNAGMVPIAARLGWHPNWGLHKNLDIYGLFKIGVGIGTSSENTVDPGAGFLIGFIVGGKWFFTPMIAAFVETGFEGSWVNYKIEEDYGYYSSIGKVFVGKYLTLGVTFKLDLKK